jgi:general L-amino acid transport system substrate-binding protein
MESTNRLKTFVALLVGVTAISFTAAAATLDAVRKLGAVSCGVTDGAVGFSEMTAKGHWSGLDVEFCRAIAAAVLGDRGKVSFVPLPTARRFASVRAGEVDLLARGTGWTFGREATEGVRFVAALFHESQAVMVRRSQGITSALELTGATICALESSRDASQIATFLRQRDMRARIVAQPTWSSLVKAYATGQCMALTADRTLLAHERSRFADSDLHVVLPEMLSHEPFGPVVRTGDDQWFAVVRWVLFALISAEEHKVGGHTMTATSGDILPGIRRMLAGAGDVGRTIGLPNGWAERLISQVGNYGDIYDRVLGAGSPLRLPRGRNALIRDGGLLWAPPLR